MIKNRISNIDKKEYVSITLMTIFVCLWLYTSNGLAKIDYSIVCSSIYAFCVINLYFYFQYRKINSFMSIYNFSVVRIKRQDYLLLLYKKCLFSTGIDIFICYIIPTFLFFNFFISIQIYLLYVLIIVILLIIYNVLFVLASQQKKQIIAIILYSIPFVTNIMLQINVFQHFYERVGGII